MDPMSKTNRAAAVIPAVLSTVDLTGAQIAMTPAALKARLRDIGRAMADETMSDADFEALRRSRDAYQAEYDAAMAAEGGGQARR